MNQDLRHREISYFAQLMANKQGISIEAAELFIHELFQLLKEGLIKDNYVHLSGLGTFKVISLENKDENIDATHQLIFVPDGELQSIINEPFEHFESVVIYSDILKEQLYTEKDKEKKKGLENQIESTNSKQTMEDHKGKKIEKIEQQSNQMKNIEASFIGIYGDKKEILPEDEKGVDEAEDGVNAEVKNQEKTPDETKIVPQNNQKSSLVWALSFIIVILVLLVLLLAFRLQSVQKELNAYVSQRTEFNTLEMGKSEAIILYPDTTETETQDSLFDIQKKEDQVEETVRSTALNQYNIPSQTSLKYTIVGTLTTHQVVPGETLRILAEVYYGSREMWPYIYYYNESLIPKPNQLLKDTVLKIPKLDNFQQVN